jgi:hypothetical protein
MAQGPCCYFDPKFNAPVCIPDHIYYSPKPYFPFYGPAYFGDPTCYPQNGMCCPAGFILRNRVRDWLVTLRACAEGSPAISPSAGAADCGEYCEAAELLPEPGPASGIGERRLPISKVLLSLSGVRLI